MKSKVAGFYTARSRTIPPLPWPTFAPPFSPKTQVTGQTANRTKTTDAREKSTALETTAIAAKCSVMHYRR